jgi:hypothetical protein
MTLNKFMLFCKEYHVNELMFDYVSNSNNLSGIGNEEASNNNSNGLNINISIHGVGDVNLSNTAYKYNNVLTLPNNNNNKTLENNGPQSKRSMLNNSLLILRNASVLHPISNNNNPINTNDSLYKSKISNIEIKRSNKIENFLV